jgi:hypothetical protein
MKDLFQGQQPPDAPNPLSSAGSPRQPYSNASGDFDLHKSLKRKVKSRGDLDQPAYTEDDAQKRYFGDFSIESKRHVWDLLDKHPTFGQSGKMRMNRVGNNTRTVLPNDPTKTPVNGSHILYQNLPQASEDDKDTL